MYTALIQKRINKPKTSCFDKGQISMYSCSTVGLQDQHSASSGDTTMVGDFSFTEISSTGDSCNSQIATLAQHQYDGGVFTCTLNTASSEAYQAKQVVREQNRAHEYGMIYISDSEPHKYYGSGDDFAIVSRFSVHYGGRALSFKQLRSNRTLLDISVDEAPQCGIRISAPPKQQQQRVVSFKDSSSISSNTELDFFEEAMVIHSRRVRSERTQRKYELLNNTHEELDSLDSFDSFEKQHRRSKYVKNLPGRINAKESRVLQRKLHRRFIKDRIRADRLKRNQKIAPHAQAVETVLEEDSVSLPRNHLREERNEMARIVATPPPPSKSDESLLDLLKSVSDVRPQFEGSDSGVIDEWIGHLENLVILGYQMNQAQSFMDVFVAIAAYAKMYTKNKSITMELYRIIDEVTTTASSDIEPHAMEDWSGRRMLDSWDLMKTNTVFKKISYLISAAMSLTVCTTKQIEWSPFGLKLIAVEAAKEQLKAVDVIDALIKTFVWMTEVGWRCFETKSLVPLLYSDQKMVKFNELFDHVSAIAESALAGNQGDLGDFEKKVKTCFNMIVSMKTAKNDGPTSLWLQKRYSEVVAIMERLAAKRRNTDIRFSPIGFSLTGPTGVGKSTLGKLTMLQSLAAMGYVDENGVVDETRILTLDMFDAFQSTYTSEILGVNMDDVGNAKSSMNPNPHTSVIIKFFNNVAAQAVKAELNAKGVVFIDFKCGIITSNVKDLDAPAYSNCPESILRRFFHVNVLVKEKYRKGSTSLLDKSHPDLKGSTTLIKDIWDLTLQEIEVTERPSKDKFGNTAFNYTFVPITVKLDDGSEIECTNIGLQDYLKVVIQLSKDHQQEQDSILLRAKNSGKTNFCSKCRSFPEYCECTQQEELVPTKDIDVQAMDMVSQVLVDAGKRAVDSYIKSWTRPADLVNRILGFSPIRRLTTRCLAREIQQEMNEAVTPFLIAITPEWLFRTRLFKRTVNSWQSAAAFYDVRTPCMFASALCLSTMGIFGYRRNAPGFLAGTLGLWATALGSYSVHQSRVRQIREHYCQRRDALPDYAKTIRDGTFPKSVLFAATIALGVKLVSLWNTTRLKGQSELPQALTPEDIEKQPGWFANFMKTIGITPKSGVLNSMPGHLKQAVCSNVGWLNFVRPDGSTAGCNVVYPKKGIVWFPLHIFHPDFDLNKPPLEYLSCTVIRNDDVRGSQFKFVAQLNVNAVRARDLDMVACFVERCPDIRNNLYRYLPEEKPTGVNQAYLLAKDRRYQMNTDTITLDYGMYGHRMLEMWGSQYKSPLAVSGSCMGPVICEGREPCVVGFHIGGNTKSQVGVMQTVTRPAALNLEKELYSLPGVRGLALATELPQKQFGKFILSSSEIHPNAKYIAGLDDTAAIDVYGSTGLRAQSTSSVAPSILTEAVSEVFSVGNRWGQPKMLPNWKAYNATLAHIVNPSDMFLPSLLQRARNDYFVPLVDFSRKIHQKEGIYPLTEKEMVMGVPGKRFLDALPMSTSMGSPVYGPKTKWFSEIRDGEKLVSRLPGPEVRAEMKRVLGCWEAGTRAYPVTTATLKDEPTPLTKEKVRVFQAVAVVQSLFIRKWFLPIARILALNPLLSESAVGVNAFSPQWEELMAHACKFAKDRRVNGWDYKAYDVRMNSQLTYAVLMGMIDMATVCGYSEYDLRIMNAMIADIIHPLMDYNGTLLMAYNMNTSGNNITVNINGMAGSLYVRMGFFHACPETKDFRTHVAALTYGDDFKGSVAPEFRSRFNFETFRDFLAEHGMTITLPDKSEDSCPDMHDSEVDFLKRHSNFIPEIGHSLGKLSEDSIFKSLHSNLKSKTETPTTVAISCIEGACHEWFAHGREIYDDRVSKLREVCRRCDLAIPATQFTFDERVEAWKEKYES